MEQQWAIFAKYLCIGISKFYRDVSLEFVLKPDSLKNDEKKNRSIRHDQDSIVNIQEPRPAREGRARGGGQNIWATDR